MKKLFILLAITFSLSGCASLFVGSASTVALSTVQERTWDDAVDDTVIKFNIGRAFWSENSNLFSDCDTTVSEARVLITGVVPTEDDMQTAIRLIWNVEGVKEVINEIEINPNGKSLVQSSKDAWIMTKIRTKLVAAKDVLSINYATDVNNSNVYIIGIAQDQKELDKVIDIVRNTTSVESVTSYVKIKDPED